MVHFALADFLETKKVQEAKFRDCRWCISIHFPSVYFDEKEADILKLLAEQKYDIVPIAQKKNST